MKRMAVMCMCLCKSEMFTYVYLMLKLLTAKRIECSFLGLYQTVNVT